MTILCALSTVLNAYDISQKLPPQGPLGVALDYSLATAFPDIQDPNNANVPRNWAWSSHLVFAQPVSTITDAQLWQIALDGYDEMIADAQDYAVGVSNRPKAMSVLAFGNELILASSQKGLTSFSYTYHSTPVLETLRLCQAVWGNRPGGTDSPHNYGGSCAELMAAQLYYTLYTTPLSARAARIATVTLQKKDGQFVPRPKDPCPDNALVSRDQVYTRYSSSPVLTKS
jgi:hypothetical protein